MNIRKYKIANNTVLFDYVATLIGAVIVSKYLEIPLVIVTIVVLILGEVMHYIFNVPTNTLKYLNVFE